MSRSSLPRKLLFLAGLGMVAMVFFWSSPTSQPRASAQPGGGGNAKGAPTLADELKVWKEKKYTYQSAAGCARCHSKPQANDFDTVTFSTPSTDHVLLTEYTVWQIHDKHAQAYGALKGKRGETIAELLGFKDATDPNAGCLACHAMSGPSIVAKGQGLKLVDGVNCGGCHGPSGAPWGNDHWSKKEWRDMDPHAKMDAGMRFLRHPEVKARLCMSCHVGSAEEGKVVTHAMYAAGHPPLPPIEIATFSENEPQHWRKARNVPYFKGKDDALLKKFGINSLKYHRTHTSLVGSIVALRETLQLAKDRANFASDKPGQYWPELLVGLQDPNNPPPTAKLQQEAKERWAEIAMTHSDCYACHHDLRYPGYRQERGFGFQLPGQDMLRVIPGRPLLRTWPLALVGSSLELTKGEQQRVNALQTQLKGLTTALNLRPFGVPSKLASSSDEIIKWCNATLKDLNELKIDDAAALKLIKSICNLKKPDGKKEYSYLPDYEAARQLAALLKVVYEDWAAANGGGKPALASAINSLADDVVVEPYVKREERLRTVLKDIVKGGNDESINLFVEYIKNVGDVSLLKPDAAKDGNKADKLQDYIGDIVKISTTKLNDGINKDPTLSVLQKISDEEQENLLRKLANFKPREFLNSLEKIGAMLP